LKGACEAPFPRWRSAFWFCAQRPDSISKWRPLISKSGLKRMAIGVTLSPVHVRKQAGSDAAGKATRLADGKQKI
jgi:hypothetical protein